MPANANPDAGAAPTPRVTVRCQFCQTWNRLDTARVVDRPKCGKCGKPILLDRPLKLDDESFGRTVAEAEIPMLVDFYADWCGPCKIMAPAIDALAAKYTGKAIVAKLDTDRATAISQQYGVRSIPTSIVFIDGREVARAAGALPLAKLEEMLLQPAGART